MVKWRNRVNGVAPPLHFSVVAIEKGAFWSPSIKFANFTFTTEQVSYFISYDGL